MKQINDTYHPDHAEDEINVIDLFLVLLKRKKLILSVIFLAVILSFIYCLVKPNTYTATARILPPHDEPSSGISGLLSKTEGAFGGLAASFIRGKSGTDLYVGILESRSVADILIKKFNLKDLYEQRFMENVYKILTDRTSTEVSDNSQILIVSVEDGDPQRAADMANAYVEALDRINRTVNNTAVYRKRVFLEKRLEKVKEDLGEAELDLKAFQEKYKLVAIDDQARAAIEGAGKIKGEIIAAQTELQVLKQFGTEKQNEAIMLKWKINELENQLAKIERGNPSQAAFEKGDLTKESSNFYIPFNEMPELGMQLARLMREAKLQEEVFKLVTTQHELAKIEEARDSNTLEVLDWAVPPDRKSGPNRRLMVIIGALLGFFAAVFLAFFLEYVDRLKTEDRERCQQIINNIRFRNPK